MKKFFILLSLSMMISNLFASYPMRYSCEENGKLLFEIQIFDLEYQLAFLNQTGKEQMVLEYNKSNTIFSTKNQTYKLKIRNFNNIDENGDGEVTIDYKFPDSEKEKSISCEAFNY